MYKPDYEQYQGYQIVSRHIEDGREVVTLSMNSMEEIAYRDVGALGMFIGEVFERWGLDRPEHLEDEMVYSVSGYIAADINKRMTSWILSQIDSFEVEVTKTVEMYDEQRGVTMEREHDVLIRWCDVFDLVDQEMVMREWVSKR